MATALLASAGRAAIVHPWTHSCSGRPASAYDAMTEGLGPHEGSLVRLRVSWAQRKHFYLRSDGDMAKGSSSRVGAKETRKDEINETESAQ
jgi:hypothetical protein